MEKENYFSNFSHLNIERLSIEQLQKAIDIMRNTKINVLVVGGTGVGKSSTINALFNTEKAKVGQGSNPETMDITCYELNNMVIWDTPGLGDSEAKDAIHKQKIIQKLQESDDKGNLLIDLVLLILDGGSRDYSSAYTLIKEIIIPNLGNKTDRLLVAINQADMVLKGKYWDEENNCPEPKLIEALDQKVISTQSRIKEATGLDVDTIYYAAGYKDGNDEQKPYNLNKLLNYILEKLPSKKRISVASDLNQDKENFSSNDDKSDYSEDIKKQFMASVKEIFESVIDITKKAVTKVLSDEKTQDKIAEFISDFISNLFKSKKK